MRPVNLPQTIFFVCFAHTRDNPTIESSILYILQASSFGINDGRWKREERGGRSEAEERGLSMEDERGRREEGGERREDR